MKRPDVVVGQIWRDRDKRMNGRFLIVERIEGTYAVLRNRAWPTRRTNINVNVLTQRFDLVQPAQLRAEE